VNLRRDQIENSPEIDTEKPVSRQQQTVLHEYFNWPLYWTTPFSGLPAAKFPVKSGQGATENFEPVKTTEKQNDELGSHLRQARQVIGYDIQGRDGSFGNVDDFILDDENWKIRYLVMETSSPVENKKVLISPFWIKSLRADDGEVNIDLTKQMIIDCPPFDPETPINREYEEVLYDYYGKPHYSIKR
jgi:hypothetical protein